MLKYKFFLVFLIAIANACFALDPVNEWLNANSGAKVSADKISNGYEVLEKAVKEPSTPAQIEKTLKMTIVLLQLDPSQHAIEVFHPVYEKNKDKVNGLVNKYKKADKERFQEALKDYVRELKEGNG